MYTLLFSVHVAQCQTGSYCHLAQWLDKMESNQYARKAAPDRRLLQSLLWWRRERWLVRNIADWAHVSDMSLQEHFPHTIGLLPSFIRIICRPSGIHRTVLHQRGHLVGCGPSPTNVRSWLVERPRAALATNSLRPSLGLVTTSGQSTRYKSRPSTIYII